MVQKIPFPPPELDAEQPTDVLPDEKQAKYKAILEYFSQEDYLLPGVDDGKLKEVEKFWLSNECLYRFLRATKWDVKETKSRLEGTLRWRREFGIDDITAEHVEPEAVTGKEVILGYDKKTRPLFYMFPSRQNTEESDRQIEFTFYFFERCMDLMPAGVETVSLMIDFSDRAKHPSIGTSLKVLKILQTHYPERLGCAYIVNVPFLVRTFFRLISPFIDPVSAAKMKFNPNVVEDGYIDPNQLMNKWGGEIDFEYEHEEYWPALLELTKTRRDGWFKNWKEMGGKIGTKEWDIKQSHQAPTKEE